MNTLSGILLIALVAWFWADSTRAREIANAICRKACRARDVQFLDQTVSLRRLGIRWTSQGVRLRRSYRFDYSCEGVGRQSGGIILVGTRLEELVLDPVCETPAPLPPVDNVVPLRRPPPEGEQ